MLVKCESKSTRVKAVAFHPTLPWVAVGLHTGTIQLWDYKRGCILYKFDGHVGPVRALHFHPSQSLFCSGGDDHEILVWDYDRRALVFKLTGHLDYIRSVEFHSEYPWILSTSDDQTLRIWNWQSRQCISVLAGHHHFVMCARFHPSLDLVASCSMDQTIRLWDITGLKERNVARLYGLNDSLGMGGNGSSGNLYGGSGGGVTDHSLSEHSQDVVCKYIIEGHDRGVNWLDFHPRMNMIVSGSDDRCLKLFRFDDTRWWEMDTLKGHYNNISSVKFHPIMDLIISNSEDHSTRVWDLNTRKLLHTIRRDNDRFWCMDCIDNTIAVGHDSGMIVFKLIRERPAATILSVEPQIKIIAIKNNQMSIISENKRIQVPVTKDSAASSQESSIAHYPIELIRNPLSNTDTIVARLYSNGPGGVSGEGLKYDILVSQGKGCEKFDPIGSSGHCLSLQFCGRTKFVVLTKDKKLELRSLLPNDDTAKELDLNGCVPEKLLYGGANNRVLIRANDGCLYMYDTANRRMAGRLDLSIAGAYGAKGRVRYCQWCDDKLVIISKNYICLAKYSSVSNRFSHLYSLHEPSRVKSALWLQSNIVIYTTSTHLKYVCLSSSDASSDNGIISSLHQNACGNTYLQGAKCVEGTTYDLLYMNNKQELKTMKDVNVCEPFLKIAIQERDTDRVVSLLSQHVPPGLSWIQYLQANGFPQIAYNYVTDPLAKIQLALKFGDLDCAYQHMLNSTNPELPWDVLGAAAVKSGRIDLAVAAFQKARSYSKLINLFSIMGDTQRLKKLTGVLKLLGNDNLTLLSAVYSGDVRSRIEVLLSQKKYAFAYLTAKSHGLTEELTSIQSKLAPGVTSRLDAAVSGVSNQKLLAPAPATSIPLALAVWPTTPRPEIAKSMARPKSDKETNQPTKFSSSKAPVKKPEQIIAEAAWNDDDDDWLGEDKNELSDDALSANDTCDNTDQPLRPSESDIRSGKSIADGKALTVADLVALGRFSEVLKPLEARFGITDIRPLKPFLRAQYVATQSLLPSLPMLGYIPRPLQSEKEIHKLYSISSFNTQFRRGLAAFGARQLDSCLTSMLNCIKQSCLLTPPVELDDVWTTLMSNIAMAAQYVTVVRLLDLAQENEDAGAKLQYHCNATKCLVSPAHHFILYKEACKAARKSENFSTCAKLIRGMAKLQLEVQVPELASDIGKMKTKLLTEVERRGTDAYENMEVDGQLCCSSLELVATDMVMGKCKLCQSLSSEAHIGKTCGCCNVGGVHSCETFSS